MGRRRTRLRLAGEANRRLARLAWLLHEPPEELLQEALETPGDSLDEQELAALEGELAEGERRFAALAAELSQVQGCYAAVKFALFEEFQRNKPLVVNLAGALAENRRLRQVLGLPPPPEGLMRELDRLYQAYLQRDLSGLVGAEGDGEEG